MMIVGTLTAENPGSMSFLIEPRYIGSTARQTRSAKPLAAIELAELQKMHTKRGQFLRFFKRRSGDAGR